MSPTAPAVGVGGVLVHEGRVLLIRRGKDPLRGRWVVPGGTVELGETLEEALVREMEEETGLLVEPLEVVTVSAVASGCAATRKNSRATPSTVM